MRIGRSLIAFAISRSATGIGIIPASASAPSSPSVLSTPPYILQPQDNTNVCVLHKVKSARNRIVSTCYIFKVGAVSEMVHPVKYQYSGPGMRSQTHNFWVLLKLLNDQVVLFARFNICSICTHCSTFLALFVYVQRKLL